MQSQVISWIPYSKTIIKVKLIQLPIMIRKIKPFIRQISKLHKLSKMLTQSEWNSILLLLKKCLNNTHLSFNTSIQIVNGKFSLILEKLLKIKWINFLNSQNA